MSDRRVNTGEWAASRIEELEALLVVRTRERDEEFEAREASTRANRELVKACEADVQAVEAERDAAVVATDRMQALAEDRADAMHNAEDRATAAEARAEKAEAQADEQGEQAEAAEARVVRLTQALQEIAYFDAFQGGTIAPRETLTTTKMRAIARAALSDGSSVLGREHHRPSCAKQPWNAGKGADCTCGAALSEEPGA
jgi:DNA repair exonuclease SbcCD ATPase subunit